MDHWTEGDVDSNGINIHYYRTGDDGKPSLILAHGFTDNGLCWQRTAAMLQAQYDIVMVDARNHGGSGAGYASIKLLASDLAAVCSALRINRTAVLGHSVGANVAAEFAASYPAMVSCVVLEDPPWQPHLAPNDLASLTKRQKGFEDYLALLQEKTEDEIIAYGKRLHTSWHSDDFPAWAASKKQVLPEAMAQMALVDWTELVPRITCPGLLIFADSSGGFDGMVTQATAQTAEKLNHRIKSHHVAQAGHNLRREQFTLFIQAVQAFLSN